MATKKHPGSGLALPAGTWNQMADAAEDYARRRQLGDRYEKKRKHWDGSRIKIKNATGSARTRGQVLKIGAALYTPLTGNTLPDCHPRNFAFSGSQVSALTDQFCILLDWAGSNSIVWAQLAGVVAAMVDIADANHTMCALEVTSYTLVSKASGPHQILAKPSGTGDKACVVHLWGSPRTRLWRFTINESLADGTASSDILTMSGSDTGFDAVVNDPLGVFDTLTDTDDAGYCLEQDGEFYAIQAPCPA